MSQLKFAARVLFNYSSDKMCPFCGSKDTELAQRKRVLLQLRSCRDCGLRFRWPKETPGFSEKYYQQAYQEVDFTTDLPDDATLRQFMDDNFTSSPKNFATEISVLKAFLPGGRVLDFGCSWGYGVYQLRNAGYDAFGFEISRPRAAHGSRALGVEIVDTLEALNSLPAQSVDGIFCSHVLEHISSIKGIFEFFSKVLKPNGVAVIMVPNGGGELARQHGVGWTPLINEKHTLALDRDFFERNMPAFGFDVSTLSGPYDPVEICNAVTQGKRLPAEGEELMVIARRVPNR
jgi:SAM-dependent methyltransferase